MIRLELDQDFIDPLERLPRALVASLQKQLNVEVDGMDGVVAVRYVSDEEIQRLNREYRKKDQVTDVLAFSYAEDRLHAEESLGDVAISAAQAKRQAEAGGVKRELAMLVVHGVLHVLGYDHEKPKEAKQMFAHQDQILDRTLV